MFFIKKECLEKQIIILKNCWNYGQLWLSKLKQNRFFHNLWLFFPKIFIKFIVYPFVKKNNIKEQYKVLDKVF